MEIQASVGHPQSASKTVDGPARRASAPTTIGTSWRARSVPQAAKIVLACLIEAIVILGFVALSLGIGAEGQPGLGPDRPPPPMTPAPAPPPDPLPVMAMDANMGSSLLGGRGT